MPKGNKLSRTSYSALRGQGVLGPQERLTVTETALGRYRQSGGKLFWEGEGFTVHDPESQFLSHSSLDPSRHRALMGPTGRFKMQWDKETTYSGLREKDGEFYVKSFMGQWYKVDDLKLRPRREPRTIETTFDGAINILVSFLEEDVPMELRKGFEHVLDDFGKRAAEIARSYVGIYQDGWSPLTPETVAQGNPNDTPLYRTGAYKDSITYAVDTQSFYVSIGSNDPHAEKHELGTRTEPPRPVLQPAIVEAAQGLPRQLAEAIDVAFDYTTHGGIDKALAFPRHQERTYREGPTVMLPGSKFRVDPGGRLSQHSVMYRPSKVVDVIPGGRESYDRMAIHDYSVVRSTSGDEPDIDF